MDATHDQRVGHLHCQPAGSQAGTSATLPVTLGGRAQVPARLLAWRVTRRTAVKRQGQPLSQERLDRAGWTISITTVPGDRLSLQEAVVLARLR